MGFIHFFYPWGVILQAIALVHFFRRRPEGYWLWIIVFLGPIGAAAYIAMEIVPDLGLLRQVFDGVTRRRKIAQLEALVKENSTAGNYEELAELHLDERHYARARDCYNKAITARADHVDPFYRRAIAEIHLGDFKAAVSDLEIVTGRDPKYDFNRAIGLLAHAYANTDQPQQAETLFQRAVEVSTLSETYLNYAAFLESQQRFDEARQWAERVLAAKALMPRYLQRRERHWFRKANSILKRLKRR